MNKAWHILSSRDETDITTMSGINYLVQYDLSEYAREGEIYFVYCDRRKATNYITYNQIDFGKFLFQKYLGNEEKVKEVIDRGQQIIAESQAAISSDKKIDDLKGQYQKFFKLYIEVAHIYTLVLFIINEYWEKEALDLLDKLIVRNKLEEKRESVFRSVLKPCKDTAVVALKKRIKEHAPIDELSGKFQFLRTWNLIWYKDLDREWFQRLDSADDNPRELMATAQIIDLLKPDDEEKEMIMLAPLMVYLKDYRDDVRRKFSFLWNPVFHEISRRFHISYDDLGYLSIWEIEELLDGKYFSEEINWRKVHPCVLAFDREKAQTLVVDRNLPARYKDYGAEDFTDSTKEVCGLSAYPGHVRGTVKIVADRDDIRNFPDSSILVANSTHPDYLPAMQRAVAIITNEGGLLCHAAIVARELGIPCIVGTKNATQVLRDGDMVEVDANKGIVRRI